MVRDCCLVNEIKPVLDQVNIVVRDMAAAVEFYRLLGVDVADTLAEWMPHHRMVESVAEGIDADLDSDTFARQWNRGLPEGWTGVVVSFRVPARDDVDALYTRATAAGYVGQQPPYDTFWGARYAIVQGPDGAIVGVMSPSEDEMRTAPLDPSAFAD